MGVYPGCFCLDVFSLGAVRGMGAFVLGFFSPGCSSGERGFVWGGFRRFVCMGLL